MKKTNITLEECQNLLSLLDSRDSDSQLLGLQLLASDCWYHKGSVATAIYEARVELGYRKRKSPFQLQIEEYVRRDFYWNIPIKKQSGLVNCIQALKRVEQKLS